MPQNVFVFNLLNRIRIKFLSNLYNLLPICQCQYIGSRIGITGIMHSTNILTYLVVLTFRGLDSSASLQCISMLKALAKGGRNIICTIHQPSARIYEMFDHVYVLAEGKCVYQGASSNTVAFLSNAGLYCPQYHNPADFCKYVVPTKHIFFCTNHLS